MTQRVRQYNNSGTLLTDDTTPYSAYNIGLMQYEGPFEMMTDEVTPSFKKRSARGEIIINPMSWNRTERLISGYGGELQTPKAAVPGQDAYALVDQAGTWVLPSLYGTHSTSRDIQSLRDIAITQAYGNVADPDAQSLVVLLESKKTMKFLQQSLGSMLGGIHALGTGKPRRAVEAIFRGRSNSNGQIESIPKQIVNAAAQKWMEYRYAWGPMFFDIRDHVNAYGNIRAKRRVARGNASDQYEYTDTTAGFVLAGTGFTCTLHRTGTNSRKIRAAIIYEETNDIRQTLNKYGLLALPSVAWELTPFSWMADWFGNLSDCFKAMSPVVGVKILGCSKTEFTDEQITTWSDSLFHSDYKTTSFNAGLEVMRYKSKVRDQFTPYFRPRITVRLNWKRGLDVLALASQTFKSMKWVTG